MFADNIEIATMKKCKWCHVSKPIDIEHFREDYSQSDGFRYICYDCEIEAHAIIHKHCSRCKQSYPLSGCYWYKFNNSQYGWTLNCIPCENKRTYQRSKNNPEKHREESKKWRDANVQKTNTTVRNGKATRKAKHNVGTHTATELEHLYQLQDGKCFYCDASIIIDQSLTRGNKSTGHVDHYIALTNGGMNTIDNLVWACHSCNIRKSVRSPQDFKIHMKLFHGIDIKLK